MTTLIPDTYDATVPWQHRALCASLAPDLFELPDSHGHSIADDSRYREQVAQAKAACRACPVTAQCLTTALAVPQGQDLWAIAGGTTPRERAAIRRRRARARALGMEGGGRP